ncbi:MAG: hypothetical protein J6R46_04950 [Clostridia bacterium]|nr:hypothetical protein [Clostridia bacterium]
MKNFTKLLIVLLALGMLAGCFAACDTEGGTTEDSTAADGTAPSTE